MTKQEYLIELAKAEVATQSKMQIGTAEIYWDEFEHWTDAQFRTAIRGACREATKFPTIRLIHANKPTNHATGALDRIKHDRGEYKPMILGPAREVPADLRNLTDEELTNIFFAEGLSGDTHEFHLKQFRKGNSLWCDMVRDAMKRQLRRSVDDDQYVYQD